MHFPNVFSFKMAKRLPKSFYESEDVVQLSRDLLGTRLVTNFNNQRTSGIIVETEAYAGPIDKASHAYGWRRTKRTEVMFRSGGLSYVYLCYGMYHLFNVVVSPEGLPHAILIRGIEPLEGVPHMLERCNKTKAGPGLTNGPGKLTRALGILTAHTGFNLIRNSPIWIEERPRPLATTDILASPRIGVDYAGEDALLPYRFTIRNNPYVSK